MNILIQLQNGSKSYGAKTLFDNATFAINNDEHIGVIGPNGAGKSTLLKALLDPTLLDQGTITRSQGVTIGHLAQEETPDPTTIVNDFLEARSARPLWQLHKMGEELGLQQHHFEQPLNSLSGGFRMRVKLLCLLGQNCDLLLLDEPTNYLDLESVLVLEKFLQNFEGSFLLISHDREFLRRTTDHTLEVEQGEITKFNGHIDDYFEQKSLLAETLRKQALSQEAKRKQILEFANRFRAKATKARQVQSKLKTLDKMEQVEVKGLPAIAKIPIPEPLRTGQQILEIEQGTMGYGEHVILKNVHLRLERGDHVGVVGINGAGKSTLLKSISQQIEMLSGHCQWGYKAEYGYFAQHVTENLSPSDTVYEAMMATAHNDILPQQVKDLAGGLLFDNEGIEKKIGVLSGGEKTRVALAQVLLKRSPILVLDEPTNHLDFHTVEALTQALQQYSGTVIVVSHDRSFISRVANKILEIRDQHVDLYPGSYDEYLWSLQKGSWSDKTTSSPPPSTVDLQPKFKKTGKGDRKKQRQLKAELSQIERSIQAVQSSIDKSLIKLQQVQGSEAQSVSKQLHEQKLELERLDNQWLHLASEIENFE